MIKLFKRLVSSICALALMWAVLSAGTAWSMIIGPPIGGGRNQCFLNPDSCALPTLDFQILNPTIAPTDYNLTPGVDATITGIHSDIAKQLNFIVQVTGSKVSDCSATINLNGLESGISLGGAGSKSGLDGYLESDLSGSALNLNRSATLSLGEKVIAAGSSGVVDYKVDCSTTSPVGSISASGSLTLTRNPQSTVSLLLRDGSDPEDSYTMKRKDYFSVAPGSTYTVYVKEQSTNVGTCTSKVEAGSGLNITLDPVSGGRNSDLVSNGVTTITIVTDNTLPPSGQTAVKITESCDPISWNNPPDKYTNTATITFLQTGIGLVLCDSTDSCGTDLQYTASGTSDYSAVVTPRLLVGYGITGCSISISDKPADVTLAPDPPMDGTPSTVNVPASVSSPAALTFSASCAGLSTPATATMTVTRDTTGIAAKFCGGD